MQCAPSPGMQQYRKCCTHPIGVSVYKWVSERGSRSAAADVAFQRELVEFIRRKICSPCHAGSSESRTVNRSALIRKNDGSPSIYSSRYRTSWAVGLASTPPAPLSRTCRANRAHDFAGVFRVRLLCRVVDTEALPDRCGRCRALDCSQGSAAAILLARFVWRHLYGLCNKMPNTSILWECILERNGRPLRWNEWLRLQRLAP